MPYPETGSATTEGRYRGYQEHILDRYRFRAVESPALDKADNYNSHRQREHESPAYLLEYQPGPLQGASTSVVLV